MGVNIGATEGVWIAQVVERRTTEYEVLGSNQSSDTSLYEPSQTVLLSCTIKMDLVRTACFLWFIVHNWPLSSSTLNDSVGYNE